MFGPWPPHFGYGLNGYDGLCARIETACIRCRTVPIPEPLRAGLRGVGQVFFQENALTGACFVLGLAVSSLLMAIGAVVGSAIGTATAWVLKFDKAELSAGIYGFNSALVGIATLFFFRPGVASFALLVVGCVGCGGRHLADATVRAVPDVHHAVHRHDLGPVLPGPSDGRASRRPGRTAGRSRLCRSRGPWRQPGHVPGEHLDGALVSRRHRA